MVRTYINKTGRAARDHAQPINSMFARADKYKNSSSKDTTIQSMPNNDNGGNLSEREENDDRGDVDEINGAGFSSGEDDSTHNGGVDDGTVGGASGGNRKREYWPPHAIGWFEQIKNEVDKSVKFTRKGGGKFCGRLPEKYRFLISPSSDPVAFFAPSQHPLTMEQFCLPDVLLWFPEALYPELYPCARPKCKWHGMSDCVELHGWMPIPRHGYSAKRVCALLGKSYVCTERKAIKLHPYSFNGMDKAVIAGSDDYVKMQWKKVGYDISHRAATSTDLLEHLRSCLNQGLGVCGFHRTLLESLKRNHMKLSVQWRAYVDSLVVLHRSGTRLFLNVNDIRSRMVEFADFDSFQYHQSIPSVAYLISRVVLLMESDSKYKTRRMQMLDGRHLSGDHSFKLAKCIISNKAKAFAAMYCIMNEFGQVVAWWFTTGTGMKELEDSIKKLRQRYSLFGYEGPESFTTDRCCQERATWYRLLSLAEQELDLGHAHNDDVKEIEVVDLVRKPQIAYTSDIALLYVGMISNYLNTQPPERRVISVDCEWRIGVLKADIISICLMNDDVYVFSVVQICKGARRFPTPLLDLLQDNTVLKCGNRFHNDVDKMKGWDVNMAPTIELGHLSHARSVTSTRSPSLGTLAGLLWHGVKIEGKDESGPRISNWSGVLSEEQKKYCAIDAYVGMKVYQRLMQIMVPQDQTRLRSIDVEEGTQVTLYSNRWKYRVAEASVCGKSDNESLVLLTIDLSKGNKVFSPLTYVNTTDDKSNTTERVTMEYLQNKARDIEDGAIIKFEWPIYFCRRTVDLSGSDDPISIQTRKKSVLLEDDRNEDSNDDDDYNGDDETAVSFDDISFIAEPTPGTVLIDESDLAGGMNNACSAVDSDAVNNLPTRVIPRRKRLRLNHYRKERVKNDIYHIFARFERVLSKEHGAYLNFTIALRDAIYVLNQDDLEACFEVLREKHNLSDEQITRKLKYDFNWFKRRVRRLVPTPKELERRYMSVYLEYKDILCAKSGKPLFGTKDAKRNHKSVLGHIRRNCISDIPFLNYYYPIGEDRHGLTIYRCMRGTEALEGLHQKLRQLVRGFSNSPRLMMALISDFLLRWNQNIEVNVKGLPKKYDGLYEGDMIEDEMEKMTAWTNDRSPPHREWISTRMVQSTGETFGLIDPVSRVVSDDDSESDASLNDIAEVVADNLLELDAGLYCDSDDMLPESLTESARWLAAQHGRWRPSGKVRGKDEWKYFQQNLPNFQNGVRSETEADNYSSINFSAFANHWNEWVSALGNEKPHITFKTANQLMDAFKAAKKRATQDATLRPHVENLNKLHQKLVSEETNQRFISEFVHPESPVRSNPKGNTIRNFGTQTDQYVSINEMASPAEFSIQERKKKRKQSKQYSKQRCRKCGKAYALPQWKDFHLTPPPTDFNEDWKQSKFLRNLSGAKVWDYCTVPIEQRDVGFPVELGRRIPRRSRKRMKN